MGFKVNEEGYKKSMLPQFHLGLNYSYRRLISGQRGKEQYLCNFLYSGTPEYVGLRQYPDDINPEILMPRHCTASGINPNLINVLLICMTCNDIHPIPSCPIYCHLLSHPSACMLGMCHTIFVSFQIYSIL